MFDVAVIGAGVVGAFVSRELVKNGLNVVILEAESDVAMGASKANSGIVHAGFDAAEGTLKAKFNREGNLMMAQTCKELGVSYKNNGSLVVAEDVEGLNDLIVRGKQNGTTGLEILNREQLLEIEPNIADNINGALYASTGGIVCPYNLTIAAIGNAMDNGATLITDFKVTGVKEGFTLLAENGNSVSAKYVVNCAGIGAEKVANLFGDYSFKIGARRGEYMLLDNSVGNFVSHTIFALPTKAGKGVLVSPTVHGNILVGPTSVEDEKETTAIRREGFDDIKTKANNMCKNIPYGAVITSFAGVRAYSDRHDFVIEESAVSGLYNVAGIESPGLTSAPAIGKYVAEAVAKKLGASEKKDFNPTRRPNDFFKKMSDEEKNELIKQRPEFGKIICRCESVTLGEILEAMRVNPKATTIDGIKLRTRAGMGRCQSGFCQPYTLEIIMEENGISFEKVTKNGGNSFVITGGEK